MKWIVAVAVGTTLMGVIVAGALTSNRTERASEAREAVVTPKSGCQDIDGDGYGLGCSLGADCNDLDGAIHPGRPEVCNFRDDDCNALVDDGAGCKAVVLDPRRVRVSGGPFLMGSTRGPADEQPQHLVEVSSLWLDRYEVTNRRYQACVEQKTCTPPKLLTSRHRKAYYGNEQFADYPVVFVDWQQAAIFCRHAGGRLPTEAEWEKAARGQVPSIRTYPWGEGRPDCTRANMGGRGSCVGDTDRVGRRAEGASPYGAMDMAGNVWEWVSDWYDPTYYAKSGLVDPGGPSTGSLKIVRGGCWLSGADSLRVSCRKAELTSTWAYNIGFRCVYPGGR